ncbi:MAG: histidine kinase, partial [Acidimicrobiales bacterium]|nr:histidine kinase [Acidimicrobiales bacterium]
MVRENVALMVWSYALAGTVYLALALKMLWTIKLLGQRSASSIYLLAAVAFSSLWGWFDLAFWWTEQPIWLLLARVADLLRYGGWFGFMLVLCRIERGQQLPSGIAALPAIAALLLVFGFVVQGLSLAGITWLGEPSSLLLMSAMSLSVLALVLLEQVYRNVTDDSRWNVKPLSLGLVGTFLFDLYLYSQAVLFNQLDADALSIRGAVHSLMAALIFLSTTRRRDWISKIRVSQKAAFHSATLFSAGIYLLFISGVGYYVRYFGGEWGRALQLGVVFSAIIGLMILALSGSVRAKFRVLIGKHFFRYRYDYREEWLKFTQT